MACTRVFRLMPRNPDQLPAWQGLVSRGAAALDDVLAWLPLSRRRIRDPAVRIHWPVHGTTLRNCMIILVH